MLKHMYIVIYFLSYSRSTVRVKTITLHIQLIHNASIFYFNPTLILII